MTEVLAPYTLCSIKIQSHGFYGRRLQQSVKTLKKLQQRNMSQSYLNISEIRFENFLCGNVQAVFSHFCVSPVGVIFCKCPLNGLFISAHSGWLNLESEWASTNSEPPIQSLSIQSVHAATNSPFSRHFQNTTPPQTLHKEYLKFCCYIKILSKTLRSTTYNYENG